jgi:hypothetical protein
VAVSQAHQQTLMLHLRHLVVASHSEVSQVQQQMPQLPAIHLALDAKQL